jgi:LPXTG-motif cell wall-anchored protein
MTGAVIRIAARVAADTPAGIYTNIALITSSEDPAPCSINGLPAGAPGCELPAGAALQVQSHPERHLATNNVDDVSTTVDAVAVQAPPDSPDLPATGGDANVIVRLAAGLVAAGFILLTLRRRRTSRI